MDERFNLQTIYKRRRKKKEEKGIMQQYETIYGNACEYEEGSETAWDLDMREEIPVEMVDFNMPIN